MKALRWEARGPAPVEDAQHVGQIGKSYSLPHFSELRTRRFMVSGQGRIEQRTVYRRLSGRMAVSVAGCVLERKNPCLGQGRGFCDYFWLRASMASRLAKYLALKGYEPTTRNPPKQAIAMMKLTH